MNSNEMIGLFILVAMSTFVILSVIDVIKQTKKNGKN